MGASITHDVALFLGHRTAPLRHDHVSALHLAHRDGWRVLGALYLDKPNEFAAFEGIWAALDNVVLSHTEADTLIANLAEEYERP